MGFKNGDLVVINGGDLKGHVFIYAGEDLDKVQHGLLQQGAMWFISVPLNLLDLWNGDWTTLPENNDARKYLEFLFHSALD